MSSSSPSMAVRLAVTLGATTLLTIGAVTVGAATSNSDKDETAESSDSDPSNTTTTQEPIPASTSTTDSNSENVSLSPSSTTVSHAAGEGGDEAYAADCLYTLNGDEFDDSFDYFVIDSLKPGLLQLNARSVGAFNPSELPSPCQKDVRETETQKGAKEAGVFLRFCMRMGSLPKHQVDADVTRPNKDSPDYVIVEQTKDPKPLKWSVKPEDIGFCAGASEIDLGGRG